MYSYDGNLKDYLDVVSKAYIQLNSCGSITIGENEFLVTRKNGRSDFHIIYVAEGTIDVTYGGTEYSLKSGDFVLYPTGMPQNYTRRRHSRDFWLHFNGFQSREIMNDAGLAFGVHRSEYSLEIEKAFRALVAEHHMKTAAQSSQENGMLVSLIYLLGKTSSDRSFACMSDNIRQVLSYIGANSERELSNDELAKLSCLSKSRFIHLFKLVTGLSPHAYLQRLRIESAKSLLLSTSLGISEISAICGYNDALYFSRLFSKCVGCSPKSYREHGEPKL